MEILICGPLGQHAFVPVVPAKCADCQGDIQLSAKNLPWVTAGRVVPVCAPCAGKRCAEETLRKVSPGEIGCH